MNRLINNSSGESFWLLDGLDIDKAVEFINESGVKNVSLNLASECVLTSVDFLLSIKGIESLAIECNKTIDVNALSELVELKEISLCKNVRADFNLGQLQNLESISVELGRWNSLPSVSMPSVKRLLVEYCKDVDLGFLKNFPNVRDFTTRQAPNLRELAGIEHCIHLERLTVGYCQNLTSISAIECLNRVNYLELFNLKRLENIESIFNVPSLKSLIIDKILKIDSLKEMVKLSNLEMVSLLYTEVLDGNFEFICAMPKLQHCYIKPNKSHYQPSAKYLYNYFKGSAGNRILI